MSLAELESGTIGNLEEALVAMLTDPEQYGDYLSAIGPVRDDTLPYRIELQVRAIAAAEVDATDSTTLTAACPLLYAALDCALDLVDWPLVAARLFPDFLLTDPGAGEAF